MKRILLVFAGSLLLNSCAFVINRGGSAVKIDSNTPGVEIYNSDHKLLGTTPTSINIKPGKDVNLVFEKDGYTSESTTITSHEMNGIAFLDAMLLCIPCIVDYPTGAIYKLDHNQISVRLKKKIDANAEKVEVKLNDVTWDVKEGYKVGSDNGSDLIFKTNIYESRYYKESLCKVFGEGYYTNSSCSNFSYVGSGHEYNIKGVVKSLQMQLKTNSDNTTTSCSLEVVWSFYPGASKNAVYTKTEKVSGNFENVDKRMVINKLLTMSALDLAENDSLYRLLLASGSKVESGKPGEMGILDATRPKYKKLSDMIASLSHSVVTVEHDEGHGSGFFISTDGYVLTNYHVVKGKDKVNVMLDQNITLSADVIRFDEAYDLALLKLSGKGYAPAWLANSDSTGIGEEVYCIGTPADIKLGQSVSKGIVSGKRKFDERIFLQTDASINPGNSGGPMINDRGEVIGMASRKFTGKGIEGLGFAIPSNTIMEMLNLKVASKSTSNK